MAVDILGARRLGEPNEIAEADMDGVRVCGAATDLVDRRRPGFICALLISISALATARFPLITARMGSCMAALSDLSLTHSI